MKFIMERSGTYTNTVWQRIVVEADSEEEAFEIASESADEDRVTVLYGDDADDWDCCDERNVTEAVEESLFYERQQFSAAANLAPVFREPQTQLEMTPQGGSSPIERVGGRLPCEECDPERDEDGPDELLDGKGE